MTGKEEPMFYTKVMLTKPCKKNNDLIVENGDPVDIIRTSNCPEGRWLSRDANHKCELNCVEVL